MTDPREARQGLEILRSRPSSLVIVAAERITRDRLAARIAEALDPEFLWFELAGPGDEATPAERELFRQNEPNRFLRIDPGDFRLQKDLGTLALWAAGRSVNTPQSLRELADFAILPISIRLALLSRPLDGAPGAIVVANAERASANFDGRAGSLRPYVQVLNRFGFTPIVTAWEQFRENATDLEYILRIEQDPRELDRGLFVRCIRGGRPSTHGFLTENAHVPLHTLLAEIAGHPPVDEDPPGGSSLPAPLDLSQLLQ
jgi:hypothetical protein